METLTASYDKVGDISDEIAKMGEFHYRGEVYLSPGAKRHILRKHGEALGDYITDDFIRYVCDIIQNPDYVGRHPNKQGTSLELVKKVGKNILVAIEVDLDEKYIYVASMYPITQGKLENRVNSGRFKKVDIDI